MKASNSKGDARMVGYEGGKIHCLWRALEQGLFPFMMNEVGELTEKNKVFVAVCEADNYHISPLRLLNSSAVMPILFLKKRLKYCGEVKPESRETSAMGF
jgi:hypothetical protein